MKGNITAKLVFICLIIAALEKSVNSKHYFVDNINEPLENGEDWQNWETTESKSNDKLKYYAHKISRG